MIFKIYNNKNSDLNFINLMSHPEFQTDHAGLLSKLNKQANPFKVTLIIAFYNDIHNLELIFESLKNQTFKNFEVIIADDGSHDLTVQKVKNLSSQVTFSVTHLWHLDKGFRKNRMLNYALLMAQSPYLIFIDGDVILHPQFIEDHFNEKQLGFLLSGRSMELDSIISKKLNPEKIKKGYIEKYIYLIALGISYQKHNNALKGFRFKNKWLLNLVNKKDRPIVGRNFSLFKSDFFKINGFDMRYEAAGTGEDSDIDYRLSLVGVKRKSMINRAVQYHVWHKLQTRGSSNEALFKRVQNEKAIVTPYGLEQLLGEIKNNQEYLLRPSVF